MESGHSEYQSNILTSKEIKRLGYEYSKDPPAPVNCNYCGKLLYPKGVIAPIVDKVMAWLEHERCTCKKATDHWARHDNEKKAREEQLKREEENARRLQKIERLLGNSGVGKRFKNRTFENFNIDNENKESFRVAKLYAENFHKFQETGEGLYFSGNNGTGKTHLAVAIALELINRGTPVICMTSIKLLQEIRRTYDKNRNVSEYEILQTYKEVDLLVIDDLGQENITEWSLTMLYDIINDRYERCLPTVVTTNLSDRELIKAWSRASDWTARAIVSRLHEMTMGVTMNGRDRRKDNKY